MRLVYAHQGMLEIRWTWLPFWMAVSPKVRQSLETIVRKAHVDESLTESELDRLHDVAKAEFIKMIPHVAAMRFVEALESIPDDS